MSLYASLMDAMIKDFDNHCDDFHSNDYVGCIIKAEGAPIYKSISPIAKGYHQYFSSDPLYVVLKEYKNYVMVRHHSLNEGITGFFKKKDIVLIDRKE